MRRMQGNGRSGQGRRDKDARAEGHRSAKPEYTAQFRVERSGVLLPFLAEKFPTSRNNLKTLLSGHYVLVNGSPVSRHDFLLAKDDEVKISKRPVLQKEGGRAEPKKKFRLKILYEDADFIAIDKPAGLLSVESDKETECTFGYVLEYMRAENPAARPYILHRIDKETSAFWSLPKTSRSIPCCGWIGTGT